jgi:hypothetical protein
MVGGGGKATLGRPACAAMIADNPIEVISAVALCAFGFGMTVGSLWVRGEWIEACRKRCLIRHDSKTGKLIFVADKSPCP